MATSDSDWEQAKALFEADKSFREIEKETGINYKAVERKAKKDKWQKGILSQQIVAMAQVKADFVTMSPSQQSVVTKESDKLAPFIEKRTKIAHLAYDRIEKELSKCEVKHIKSLVEAADKVNVMVETAPRFNPNSTTINNNVNAQQNNGGEKPSILVRFVDNDKDVIDGEAGELSEQVSEYISAAPL